MHYIGCRSLGNHREEGDAFINFSSDGRRFTSHASGFAHKTPLFPLELAFTAYQFSLGDYLSHI